MLLTLVAVIVSFFVIAFTAITTSHVITSATLGVSGCYRSSTSFSSFNPFTLLFVFALGVFSLTLVRVIQSWRSDNGPLYAILVKHNIFYYVCGLLLSAVNVLTPMLLYPTGSYFLLEGLQVFMLSILATRMHLHLWDMDQHVDSSDALVCIPLSNVSPADRAV
ncbi:hypothetical protein EDB19DRAFT_1715357 [Suillus lakei]|nr:hypothetical protein EDB19DRAFT_1715357 [Suillus lakei]